MTRVKSQIQHDYKSLVKPERPTPRRRSRRWFVIGLILPVAFVALVLLLSPGGKSQTARAATSVGATTDDETSTAAQRASVALATPALPAPAPSTDVNSPAAPVAAGNSTANTTKQTTTVALALPAKPANTSDAVDPAPAAAQPERALDLPSKAEPAAAQHQSAAKPASSSKTNTLDSAASGNQTRALTLPKRNATTTTGLDAVDAGPGEALRLTIASGDSLDKLFIKHKLSRGDLATLLNIDEAKNALTLLMPGDNIDLRHEGARITSLTRQLDEERTLQIDRDESGFKPRIVETPVEIRISHASATINSSLFLAAKAAGISDNLTMNLAGVFAWDIDFVLDIRKGDRFSVIYEEIWQDGRHLRDGNIVAAMFENDGDVFRALRYTDPEDNVGYFTPDGVNVKKAFLRAPIKFSPRVTSSFNPKRMHPVHKRVRPHQGVDYGAPTGTPIIAAGDGKVIFRGRKGGYGNTVVLQHGGNITTLYAHMSKFNRSAKNGSRVKQGQVIGYVGATGTVTARHLHYEYRVNGVHRNPRTVSLPKARPIPSKFRDDFRRATAGVQNQLKVVARDTRVASAD